MRADHSQKIDWVRIVQASVLLWGPGLVCLVPMAAAPAMPAIATFFYPKDGGALFAQMVMTSPAVALILTAPFAGFLAERFGQRRVFLASLAVYLIGGLAALSAQTAMWLVASRLLLGVAAGALLTSSLALVGQIFDGHLRERVLGFGVALSSTLAAVALTFGGRMVDVLGWRGPFMLYALAAPVLAAGYLLVRPPPVVAAYEAAVEAGPVRWGPLLRLWPYLSMLTVFVIGMFTPSIQGPFLLQSEGIASAAVQGTIISVCSIVAIFAAMAYGSLRSRLGLEAMLVLTTCTFGVGDLMMAALHGVWTAFGAGVSGIGAGLAEATTASAILVRAPRNVHGRAMGLMVSALFLGQWLNPLAFTPLRAAFGIRGSMAAAGALFLLLAAVLAMRPLGRCLGRLSPSAAPVRT